MVRFIGGMEVDPGQMPWTRGLAMHLSRKEECQITTYTIKIHKSSKKLNIQISKMSCPKSKSTSFYKPKK